MASGASRPIAPRSAAGSGPPYETRRIEIGWILDRRFDEVGREAAVRANREVAERLRSELPDFAWSMPIQDRKILEAPVEEPVALLEIGSIELSIQHWDFAFVVTSSDLRGYLVGHFGGLDRCSAPETVLEEDEPAWTRPQAACFGPLRLEELRSELGRVADQRPEERAGAERWGSRGFHLRAAWTNRREILATSRRNRAWEFPLRTSRLTAAAVSASELLMATAESWEIAARAVASLLGLLLFDSELVAVWAGLPESAAGKSDHLHQSGLVAEIAVLVGALGASFEGQSCVEHLAYVDEEI